MSGVCDRCGGPRAVDGKGGEYRFCADCKKAVIEEMEESHYLQSRYPYRHTDRRSQDEKENQHETKRGIDK